MNSTTPNSPSRIPTEYRRSVSLRQLAILKTLVYSDIFDFPLTFLELHSFLMGGSLSLGEIKEEVKKLYQSGYLAEPSIYISLAGRETLTEVRREREANTQALLRKNQFWLKQICLTPFVRMVAISGAAAHGNCVTNDDIDLFIIVESNRLWSAYAFLALVHKLFGKRKTLCLNYLITTGNPSIEEKEPFVAHEIASLRVISGFKIFESFIDQNAWVKEYFPNWETEMTKTRDEKSGGFRFLVEVFLALPVFDWWEDFCRWFYLRRWKKYIENVPQSDSVILSRDRIKIYTNDHRELILDNYQTRLKEILGS